MVERFILDPHPIIKQAGMVESATSNAAGLLFGLVQVLLWVRE